MGGLLTHGSTPPTNLHSKRGPWAWSRNGDGNGTSSPPAWR